LQPSPLTPEFSCEVRPDRERAIVHVAGELDLCAAPQVAATVEQLLEVGFEHIVIDLRDLSFVDSAGVHTLVAAHRAAEERGSAVSLVRGPRPVHRVLELTATDSLFSFDDAGGMRGH
jgi:anti-sigma B factor antagonist